MRDVAADRGAVFASIQKLTTFVVNQDGILFEKDLGAETDAVGRRMTAHNRTLPWHRVQ
jgi:Protein of unknown function (DUF2950)